ncbi:MAG: hypothetical protein ABW352_09080, partial [Polyangiales bacterium]
IVGEISAASQEQSTAIEQVNNAVTKMDESTQQNSALVEQTASAAASLAKQGSDLLETVGQFQTDDDAAPRQETRAKKPAPKPAAKARPAPPPPARAAAKKPPPSASGRGEDEDGFVEF